MKLSVGTKVFLVISCFAIAIVGFMMKLPSTFRHVDKELHSIFYFGAAAFLNLLFANKNILKHAAIFIALYCFSVGIEYAQEYSNKFFHRRIHGRYDIEDIQANLKGLIYFSIVWIAFTAIWFLYKSIKLGKTENPRQVP